MSPNLPGRSTFGTGDTQATLYFNFGGLMGEKLTDGNTVTTND
ncbi:MAG TPA: hypothetical protein VGG36_02885 [Rhizomicrobium sp.]|jgi:hypothetical protein